MLNTVYSAELLSMPTVIVLICQRESDPLTRNVRKPRKPLDSVRLATTQQSLPFDPPALSFASFERGVLIRALILL